MMENVETPSWQVSQSILDTELREATAPWLSLFVHRICSRCKRSAGSSSVRSVSCFLSVHYIGSNGQNGKSVHRISVSRVLPQLFYCPFRNLDCDLVNPVVIVSVFREIRLQSCSQR